MGEVLAVGPGGRNKDGVLVEMTLKVGQKVYFAKYGPTEIKIDDEEYLVVDEKDILATVE
jgi:chaperonin GroES